MFHIKVCQWINSNRGPLVSEASVLPTEPQPLPNLNIFNPQNYACVLSDEVDENLLFHFPIFYSKLLAWVLCCRYRCRKPSIKRDWNRREGWGLLLWLLDNTTFFILFFLKKVQSKLALRNSFNQFRYSFIAAIIIIEKVSATAGAGPGGTYTVKLFLKNGPFPASFSLFLPFQ